MCLAIPGLIEKIKKNPLGMTYGDVQFGGITKEICLDLVPDAAVGEYVITHAGTAISKVDEEEAGKILELIKELPDFQQESSDEIHG